MRTGPSGAGKTTILKQMGLLYDQQFSPTELEESRTSLIWNILADFERVFNYMHDQGMQFHKAIACVCAQIIPGSISY